MFPIIRNNNYLYDSHELNDNNLSFKTIDGIIEIEKNVIEKSDILKNIFNLNGTYAEPDKDDRGNYTYFFDNGLGKNSIILIIKILENGLESEDVISYIKTLDEDDYIKAKMFAKHICIDIPLEYYILSRSKTPKSKDEDIYDRYEFFTYLIDYSNNNVRSTSYDHIKEFKHNRWEVISQELVDDKYLYKTLLRREKNK